MNRRERAARRAGNMPIDHAPEVRHATEYQRAMARQDKAALAAWVVQHNVARILAAGWLLAALVALVTSGWKLAAMLAVIAAVFWNARPPPDDRLDNYTNRKAR